MDGQSTLSISAKDKYREEQEWVSTLGLTAKSTSGAKVYQASKGCWRLEIPPGPSGRYRLSQLDDYTRLARNSFPWSPPISISLYARASHENNPGTWGFGFWNDPFNLSVGFKGGVRRSPALPNAAWFFFASEPNYLSLRDDIPAKGKMSATFQSMPIFTPLLALGALALPLFAIPLLGRWFRLMGRRFIKQDAAEFAIEAYKWHQFDIDWNLEHIKFQVDGQLVLKTTTVPFAPLGLVIWIDNQYAAFAPDGRPRYGTLANPEPAWFEVDRLTIANGL